MLTVNRNPAAKEIRNFGRAMLVGFAFLAVLAWVAAWRSGDRGSVFEWTGSRWQIIAITFLAMAGALFALTKLSVPASRAVYVVWMSAAVAIGMVMSTILLTLMFFLLLPVFSLIVRMGDPMRRRIQHQGSFWEDYRPFEPTLERMCRLF